MKKQTTNQKAERFQGFVNSLSYRLERLFTGSPENQFDAWLRKDFYPVLAVWHVMHFAIDEKLYERSLSQLREGEPKSKNDAWLGDRF